MQDDKDDPNSGGAKEEIEYYPRITALNYMITADSPKAHKDILEKQWHPTQAGDSPTVKINHRGVGQKKSKKLEVPNISGCKPSVHGAQQRSFSIFEHIASLGTHITISSVSLMIVLASLRMVRVICRRAGDFGGMGRHADGR